MRAPRTTLSEVARDAVSASNCGARCSILHHASARRLSTITRAVPWPPVHLQDLVNQAMKPTFLSSTLLSPAPRRQRPKAESSEPTQLAQTPSVSKTSGSASAKRSSNLTDATGNKIFRNRALLIIRLIRLNRILSAMTAFVADVANPARTPFSPRELEDFVIAMRRQSKQHTTARPAPKQSDALNAELWRPSRLDPSICATSLSIPTQCMYAIATIYDVCLERNCQPTAKMVSAMLSTFAGLLGPDQMFQAADTALRHLVPPSAPDQDVHLRMINHAALSSFISTYGRVGKPQLGEALLSRWANAQRTRTMSDQVTCLHADKVINLAGWGNNVSIWQALIKSRVDANDLAGARKWLDRYRTATHQLESNLTPGSVSPPAIHPAPYLAYMVGIRDAAMLTAAHKNVGRIASEIRDVMKLMMADQAPIESSVLVFVIGFEAKVGNVAGAVSLFDELSVFIEAGMLIDANLLQALFQIRKVAANNEAEASRSAPTSASVKSDSLPSTRSLVRSLVRVGDGEVTTSNVHLATCRSRGMLNDALMATMTERDYPASIVVLNLFERWRIQPSHTTYSIVLDALVAQDQHLAFFAESGEVAHSNSRLNFEATLQSMAREGNGKQADAIRRALGHQPFYGESFVVSAQPSTTLRQTQYLVRILNRVCAAEIRRTCPERVAPKWLFTWRNEKCGSERWKDERGSELSKEAVQETLRSLIYATQDEMLGKKKEKGLRVKRTPQTPLFRSTATLSTRRFGSRWPSGQAKSARAFCTSAVTKSDSGASCDLATAAKGDYQHLDPVRAIYIPGFVPYQLGLALQEHLVKQRSDARAVLRALADTSSDSASTIAGLSTIAPSASETDLRKQASQDTLLLLQHRPVYTEGRRHDSENEMVSNHLRSLGADYHLTKRGGQITYHGPGQLVGYPILNLASMNLASRCYVDRIQDSLISLLAERGIPTVDPPDDHTGVWADEYHKIASIGIQVRHRISSHGFALNVEKRAMQGFRHIVACGIVGRNMTCIQDRLDPNGPFAKYNPPAQQGKDVDLVERVQSVAESYKHHFAKLFGRRVRDATEHEFRFTREEERHAEKLKTGLNIDVAKDESVVSAIKVDGGPVMID